MAGGITLFALMTFILPLSTIIPIHGVVQFFSNSSRVFLLRKNVSYKILFYYSLGLLPGVFLALYIRNLITNNAYIFLFVSLLIFYALIKDKFSKRAFELKYRNYFFVALFVGALSILAGAVGPFLAIFFQRRDMSKEEIVATKASTQMLTHFIKIPTFIYLQFDFWEYRYLIISMVAAAFIGTKIGVEILHKINKKTFFFLFRSALLIAGARLFYKSVSSLLLN